MDDPFSNFEREIIHQMQVREQLRYERSPWAAIFSAKVQANSPKPDDLDHELHCLWQRELQGVREQFKI